MREFWRECLLPKKPVNMVLLVALIVIIGLFAVGGSLLSKKATPSQ